MGNYTVRLMNEFLHGPVWVLGEDHISAPEGSLPIVEDDPEIRELNERIGGMFDDYYSFNSHDCGCWFDEPRQRAEAESMLDLAWCLFARVCELNDGSFRVEDDLIPQLERLVELDGLLPHGPARIESTLEIDPYYPIGARFNVAGGTRRYAEFRGPRNAAPGPFVVFWIQHETNLPEHLYLLSWNIRGVRHAGRMKTVDVSEERVCLGFSEEVPCKKLAVTIFDDGASLAFSGEEPCEWRRAGDVLFGYDGNVNLLEIRFVGLSPEEVATIERYLSDGDEQEEDKSEG